MNKKNDTIVKISECKHEFSTEVPAEQVQSKFDEILEHFRKRAKLKGFRPGTAPRDMIKQMYYQDIKETLINELAPPAVTAVLRENELVPVTSPVVKKVDFQEGSPLKLTAEFEIWPDFKLPEYKKIKVDKKLLPITAKDINQSLSDLQARSARYVPVEGRGITADDYVMIEIKGEDTARKKMLPTEKTYVLVGHEDNEKALNDNLLSMKLNEEKNFSVDYPQDHKNKRLAGKKISYRVKVLSIKARVLPELNDEFAAEIGKFETLKDLEAEIKKELTENRKKTYERELLDEIVKQVADKVKIELPESVIEQETLQHLQRILSSRPNQKIPEEELEELRKQSRERAQRVVKNHLILNKIAEAEKLEVTEDDAQEEMKRLAEAYKVPLPQVVESMNREGRREEMMQNLRLKKTVDFLRENAIIG